MSVNHDIPNDAVTYRHTETADSMQYIGRDGDTYRFSVNSGKRTMNVETRNWDTYKEFLTVD